MGYFMPWSLVKFRVFYVIVWPIILMWVMLSYAFSFSFYVVYVGLLVYLYFLCGVCYGMVSSKPLMWCRRIMA